MADAAAAIREAWIILQEEVAQRLLARPGTKAYGRLTVLAQYRWEVEPVMAVPRRAFFSQPRVDSSCIVLRPRRVPLAAVRDEALFFAVVKAAFSQRRKTLINCLTGLQPSIDRPAAAALVRQIGVGPTSRGETLSLKQFAALANAVDDLESP